MGFNVSVKQDKRLDSLVSLMMLTILMACLLGCQSTQDKEQNNLDYQPQRQDLYDGSRLSSINQSNIPTTESQALAIAQKARQQGHIDKALFAYIQALDFNSQNPDTFYQIGQLHSLRGNQQLALRAYKEALSLNDDLTYAHAAMGILLMKKKSINKAKEHIDKAIMLDQLRLSTSANANLNQLSPLDMQSPVKAYSARGVINDLEGEHELAQHYFLKALVLLPSSPELATNLGYSYYLGGNYAAAENYLKTAIDNNPKYQRAWTNLGLVYIKQGMYNRALSTFEQVMREADALNDLGYFLMLEGKYQQAETLFLQAINASPQYFEQAQKNLKRVQAELQAKQSNRKRRR